MYLGEPKKHNKHDPMPYLRTKRNTKKRGSAKNDLLLFKIGVVAGAIIMTSLIFLIGFGLPAVVQEFSSAGVLAQVILVLLAGLILIVQSYGFGAGLVGIKKTVLWCWRSTSESFPSPYLRRLYFLCFSCSS
ncbi:MAG: hypothetical protein LBE76_05850 [Nitrososphaerota archaeon]|jgi:hypothetical protein|nr:hypothetical protein [Nitrososphaerota archaeon]